MKGEDYIYHVKHDKEAEEITKEFNLMSLDSETMVGVSCLEELPAWCS